MKKPTIKTYILGALIIGFAAFVVSNTKDLIVGAPLSVRMLKDGSTVADPYLPIEGNAKHAKELHINGRPVPLDQEGNFSDGVVLSPGYNVVTISQEDKFGNQKERVLRVVAEPSPTAPDTALDIHYQQDE